MALGDGKSVLLLGAGASAPFNIPIGGGMIEAIGHQLDTERKYLGAKAGQLVLDKTRIGEALSDLRIFYKMPIHATIGLAEKNIKQNRLCPEEFQTDMAVLLEFERLLHNQTSDSIDDFIVQNPNLSRLSKIAIASIIFLKSYSVDEANRSLLVRQLDRRTTSELFKDVSERSELAERNWIHLMINIARDRYFDSVPDPSRRIRIITFNYDMILEHVLERQFRNTQRNYSDYTDYFEILHVHGQCGRIDDEIRERGRPVIESWAEGIHVVRETDVSQKVQDDRLLARKWVESARNIHCVGFSFARANVKLIGLDACPNPNSLNYCNYNRSVGVKKNAESCAAPMRQMSEDRNDDDRPLRVSDWFATGYAGELPS